MPEPGLSSRPALEAPILQPPGTVLLHHVAPGRGTRRSASWNRCVGLGCRCDRWGAPRRRKRPRTIPPTGRHHQQRLIAAWRKPFSRSGGAVEGLLPIDAPVGDDTAACPVRNRKTPAVRGGLGQHADINDQQLLETRPRRRRVAPRRPTSPTAGGHSDRLRRRPPRQAHRRASCAARGGNHKQEPIPPPVKLAERKKYPPPADDAEAPARHSSPATTPATTPSATSRRRPKPRNATADRRDARRGGLGASASRLDGLLNGRGDPGNHRYRFGLTRGPASIYGVEKRPAEASEGTCRERRASENRMPRSPYE